MFITFTKKFDHSVDNIKNGFFLNQHKVKFSPSVYESSWMPTSRGSQV